MFVDPKTRFIIGLIVTGAIGISSGTVVLTNAIPVDWIKPVVAWCGIIAFFGSAAQTTLSGLGMTDSSRIASAAAVDGVKGFQVTPDLTDVAKAAAGTNASVTTTASKS